jgi:hypothetical protein
MNSERIGDELAGEIEAACGHAVNEKALEVGDWPRIYACIFGDFKERVKYENRENPRLDSTVAALVRRVVKEWSERTAADPLATWKLRKGESYQSKLKPAD